MDAALSITQAVADSAGKASQAPPLEPSRTLRTSMPVGGPFTLVDHDGIECSLSDFHGKLVVLAFGCVGCPEACAIDLFNIAETVRALGTSGEQIQPLFITIDPERDTPWRLSCYVPYFHPRFVGLTGTLDEIREVAFRYGVRFSKLMLDGSPRYRMDHDAEIFLLDREGRSLGSLPSGAGADRLLEAIRVHLR
jgi:protein SCO1/2